MSSIFAAVLAVSFACARNVASVAQPVVLENDAMAPGPAIVPPSTSASMPLPGATSCASAAPTGLADLRHEMPIALEIEVAALDATSPSLTLSSHDASPREPARVIAAAGYNTIVLAAADVAPATLMRASQLAHRANLVVVADWRAGSSLAAPTSSWARDAAAFLCASGADGLRIDLSAALASDAPEAARQMLRSVVQALRAQRPGVVLVGRGPDTVSSTATVALDAGGLGLDFVDTAPASAAAMTSVPKNAMSAKLAAADARRSAHLAPARPLAARTAIAAAPARGSRLAALMLVGRPVAVPEGQRSESQRLYAEQQATAQAALALLAHAAVVDARELSPLPPRAPVVSPFASSAPDDERTLRERGAALFARLARFARKHPAFAPAAFDHTEVGMADARDGRQVAFVRRTDPATGRTIYAVVNLNHFGLTNLRLTTAAEGELALLLDSDGRDLGGKGELWHRLPGGRLRSEPRERGGAPLAVIPYIAPYATLLLEAR